MSFGFSGNLIVVGTGCAIFRSGSFFGAWLAGFFRCSGFLGHRNGFLFFLSCIHKCVGDFLGTSESLVRTGSVESRVNREPRAIGSEARELFGGVTIEVHQGLLVTGNVLEIVGIVAL